MLPFYRELRIHCQCWWSVESHVQSLLGHIHWSWFGTWPTSLAWAAVLTTTLPWASGALEIKRIIINKQDNLFSKSSTFQIFVLLTQNRLFPSVQWQGWMRQPSCWGRWHMLFLVSWQTLGLVEKNSVSTPDVWLRIASCSINAIHNLQ